MSYKWNESRNYFDFWDVDKTKPKVGVNSDKEIINNPYNRKFEDVLRALCNVVSELVEIQERKE